MKHIFQQGTDVTAPVLVLFHGTGGTEQDLLPLAQAISPTSSVLSVRGNVLENGMPRFFRRLAEGIFDEEDLIFRTKELYDFLDAAAVEHGFDRSKVVAVRVTRSATTLLRSKPCSTAAASRKSYTSFVRKMRSSSSKMPSASRRKNRGMPFSRTFPRTLSTEEVGEIACAKGSRSCSVPRSVKQNEYGRCQIRSLLKDMLHCLSPSNTRTSIGGRFLTI